jgi:hypothetical protein
MEGFLVIISDGKLSCDLSEYFMLGMYPSLMESFLVRISDAKLSCDLSKYFMPGMYPSRMEGFLVKSFINWYLM